LIFISSALFFLGQIVVAWVFRGNVTTANGTTQHLQYNMVLNTISDLGNTACGNYHGGYVCSPRWVVMDVVFAVVGLCMIIGSALLFHEYCDRNRSRASWLPTEATLAAVGFVMMAVGGLGAITIACFPENTIGFMHEGGAALGIGVGNLGIFVLGASLGLPESMRRNMLIFSSFSITALILFAFNRPFGLGPGTMERLAAYPQVVWMIAFGLYVWRFNPRAEYERHQRAATQQFGGAESMDAPQLT